jgi:hypothetical protein
MSDLDNQIRSVIGELLDAAPEPPSFPDPPTPSVTRRGRQHRRGPLIAAIIVASAVAVGVLATTFTTRRPTHVAIQPSKHLTVADVSFAIFDRRPTPADALPRLDPLRSQEGVWIDPTVGSRLAIQTARHRIYLVKACAVPPTEHGGRCPSPSVRYCIEVSDYLNGEEAGGGGGCTTASALLKLGASWMTGSGTNNPVATEGFVPDFVSRVTYEGRNIPIINNAFIMEGIQATQPLDITTYEGDQRIGSAHGVG